MKRFLLGFVFLCCAALQSAFAVVPLEVQAAIQLPGEAVWDVQHCVDDTSFGWACMKADTLFSALRLGDSVRFLIIPFQEMGAMDGYWVQSGPFPRLLRLTKVASQSNHVCAVLSSAVQGMFWSDESGQDYNIFTLIDLERNVIIGNDYENAGCRWSDHGNGSSTISVINMMTWPPLPGVSSFIAYVEEASSVGEHMGGEDFNIGWGKICKMSFTPSFSFSWLCNGNGMLPFADFNQSLFILGGAEYSETCRGGGASLPECFWTTSSFRGKINFENNHVDTVSSCYAEELSCFYQPQVPQHDANGTNRVILSGGYGVSGPHFSDTLWHNPAISGDLYTARIYGSNDERVLSYNRTTRVFSLYDAGSGDLIDSTTSIEGSISYLIKQPNHSDEIVTIGTDRLVRIYGSLTPVLSAPGNVVCSYNPADSTVRLCWSRVLSANRYKVYSQPLCSEAFEEWIADVSDTNCMVPVARTRECFRITAVSQ